MSRSAPSLPARPAVARLPAAAPGCASQRFGRGRLAQAVLDHAWEARQFEGGIG
jgi:hypothetical protein